MSSKRYSVLFFFLLFFSIFLYFQTSSDKPIGPSPTEAKVSAPAATESKARLNKSYGKLPIRFEANVGQTDEQVKFLARDKGYSLFLTPQEAVMVLPVGPTKSAAGSVKKVSLGNDEPRETQLAAIRMSLLNANPSPKMFGEDELVTKSNYLIGADPEKWRTNVGNFGRVRYEEAYPGIDLIYYGNPQQLEYDFVVSPGAAPDVIKIKFAGQDRIEIDESGNLILKAGEGRVVQNAPVVYQSVEGKRIPVEGRYVLLSADSVGFKIGDYDTQKDLIIDPSLVFSTYLGGALSDTGRGIAVDFSGNAYVTGDAASSDFPVVGGVDSSLGGTTDAFVSKLNAAGSALIYSTYLGGAATESGSGIALDSSGNAYVIGTTSSSDFPFISGGVDSTLGGTFDAFISKLNAAGSALTYSTYLGGAATEGGSGIALDSSGNAYVIGTTTSSDFPFISGGVDSTFGGTNDLFVSKLNAAGSALTYSTYLGGSSAGSELGNAIAVDSSGNAYVTGSTNASNFPTTAGALDTTPAGGDAFVSKLNAAGSALTYSTYLGGASFEIGRGIAVDSSGNAYVAGETGSSDFPTVGAIDSSLGGGRDAFVSKLNAAGSALIYSTYLGGSGVDNGVGGIAVDSSGSAYVTGETQSSDFPTVAALDATLGSQDVFVSKLNAAGSALTFSTFLGGSSSDIGRSIAVDSSGNAYVTGQTQSSDFPTVAALDATLGSRDAFVTKYTFAFFPPTHVVSPFWQAEAGIYTFVVVSHPSLSGMSSRVGVTLQAVDSDGAVNASATFTVNSSASKRLFIVPSTAFGTQFAVNTTTASDAMFLVSNTTNGATGQLQFLPASENAPSHLCVASTQTATHCEFEDIRALSFWGAIVVLNTATGFAMEFVGDMQDSRAFSSANFSGVN